MGAPPNQPFIYGFCIVNHPAIGDPPLVETPMYRNIVQDWVWNIRPPNNRDLDLIPTRWCPIVSVQLAYKYYFTMVDEWGLYRTSEIGIINQLTSLWRHHIFYFPIYWVANHPNWLTHIFQRGGWTTNQIGILTEFPRCNSKLHPWRCRVVVNHLVLYSWSRIGVDDQQSRS